MGGVIVDVRLERAIENFVRLGVSDADKMMDACHHKGIFIDFENGDIDTEEFCRLLSAHVGKHISYKEIENAWRSIIDPPKQYKLDFISKLRTYGYKLFILTNNNPILINWARTKGYCPDGLALSDYFDKMYVSYEMKCTKPAPEIFQQMIADAGIFPSETLYIDDSQANITTAASLGFNILLVENGSDWRPALQESLI